MTNSINKQYRFKFPTHTIRIFNLEKPNQSQKYIFHLLNVISILLDLQRVEVLYTNDIYDFIQNFKTKKKRY